MTDENTEDEKLEIALHSSDYLDTLREWGLEPEDLIYEAGENRLPQLHPLFQALIAERLQFDGDMPELRTGPLPEGATPAVPVKSTGRNPILLGAMLKAASKEVAKQLQAAQQHQKALSESPESSDALPVSVVGYEPGKAPALREVQAPDPHQTMALSLVEKQALFSKALKSTQGRKSATPVIQQILLDQLTKSGFQVRGVSPTKEVEVSAKWTVEVLGDDSEMNPRFSYLDIAAQALTRKIASQISTADSYGVFVRPINMIQERWVGWEAHITKL